MLPQLEGCSRDSVWLSKTPRAWTVALRHIKRWSFWSQFVQIAMHSFCCRVKLFNIHKLYSTSVYKPSQLVSERLFHCWPQESPQESFSLTTERQCANTGKYLDEESGPGVFIRRCLPWSTCARMQMFLILAGCFWRACSLPLVSIFPLLVQERS